MFCYYNNCSINSRKLVLLIAFRIYCNYNLSKPVFYGGLNSHYMGYRGCNVGLDTIRHNKCYLNFIIVLIGGARPHISAYKITVACVYIRFSHEYIIWDLQLNVLLNCVTCCYYTHCVCVT